MKYLRIIYKYWMKGLKLFGDIQMFVLLTLIYMIFIPIFWILTRFFSDNLNIKTPRKEWSKTKNQTFNYNYFKLQG